MARLAVRLGARADRRPADLLGGRRRTKHVRVAEAEAGGAPFDWDAAADHCRIAWLRGRFLARGSLSLASGRAHLEFVVPPAEAPVLAARLDDLGHARVVADPARPGRRDLEERRHDRHVPPPRSAPARRSSSSRAARSRVPCAATSTG